MSSIRSELLIHGSHLWVVTSTFDEKKGNRIDVYNFNAIFAWHLKNI
jgi:3D (Asp-Asp-Asp) domain-containing protein